MISRPWGNSLKQRLNSKTRAKSLPIKGAHFCPVLSPPCPPLICSPRLLCRYPVGGGWDWRMYDWVWSYWTGTALLMPVWQEAWQATEGTAGEEGWIFALSFIFPYIYMTLSFLLRLCPSFLSQLFFQPFLFLSGMCSLWNSACAHPDVSRLFKTDMCKFDYCASSL